MSWKNTPASYGKLSIMLHWLMALLIISLITVGFLLDEIPRGPDKLQIINLHKATGFLVLMLALFRWIWTLSNAKPKPLANWSKATIGISHAMKWSLMLLMVIMPVSGWLMSMYAGHGINFFGLTEIASLLEKNKNSGRFYHEMHEIGGITIAVLIGLHLLAALKHHFIVKDNTLTRMLGK